MSTETAREPKTARPSRRPWTLAALAMTMGLALYLTWRATLSGLPDIGDPFDIAAFADARVADDDNAFVLYRQAVAKLERQRGYDSNYDWATATESMRRWLAANAEPLRLWRRGTERPDALDIPPRAMTFATLLPVIQELRTLGRLARLEGSRLEAEGDLSGALGWYVAILRSGKHCGRRGFIIERLVGISLTTVASARIDRWATDPRVDAVLLRRALADAIAAEAMTPPSSDMLKCEYVSFLNSLDDPALMESALLANSAPGPRIAPGLRKSLDAARRVLRREPERSRRVLRLVFANWLAYCDLPPDRRPPAVVPNPPAGQDPELSLLNDLFALDATAPAAARALPPADLARWHRTTLYTSAALPDFKPARKAIDRERTTGANLLIRIANEIHRRDHGDYPATVEELVGPYLKALPGGYKPAGDEGLISNQKSQISR